MGRKRERGAEAEPACESCEGFETRPGNERPARPSSWKRLEEDTLYRCTSCARVWRVWNDTREWGWTVERIPPVAEPFALGKARLAHLWPAAQERGWTSSALFRWVAEEDYDFAELARGVMRRVGAAGTKDAERERLLALLRCGATGESGRVLWRAIRDRRGEPLRLDLSPLIAIVERRVRGSERHGHQRLVEEVERVSAALLGRGHGRAVDLVDPPGGQRERLLRSTAPRRA